ncbi:MAG: hypothetical protein DI538_12790 [Azospira oryzae]|jgi:hypothetical protein|nr:MAG: hypothetical protein DI538_12790 [Azospira oryzae]
MTHVRHFLISLLLMLSALATHGQLAPYNQEHTWLMEELTHSFTYQAAPLAPNDFVDNTDDTWLKWTTVSNYHFGKDRGDLTMIADLSALHPYFRDQIIQLIKTCKAKGITLAVVESFRTSSKQNEYKSMGEKYTRSKGGRSKHQYGLAIDLVPIVDSVAQWHNKALWKRVGIVGEQLGLRWGGRWRHLYDPGHFEWTGGLSMTQLANGEQPSFPNANKYPCLEEDLNLLKKYWNAWENEQATISRKEATTATQLQ